MKKIIAIAALIASMQASAFWGWNDSYNNGYFDGVGAADAEADFSFDMTFSASMRGGGRGNGDGYGYGAGRGHSYNAHVPYYGAPYGYVPMVPVEPAAE
jgi:hypothetical protein